MKKIKKNKIEWIYDPSKGYKDNETSKIESWIQFVRDEIVIRIESLKYELDEIGEELIRDLEEIKIKMYV